MFRHLSPKGTTTNDKLKFSVKARVEVPMPPNGRNSHLVKVKEESGQSKGGDTKKFSTFLTGKQDNNNPPKINLPTSPVIKHTNNSTDSMKPPVDKKKVSTFDDYFEKKPRPTDFKTKKGETSLSGDSYQSQGFFPAKKGYVGTKSIGDKGQIKSKNLVSNPLNKEKQQRTSFKSPNVRSSKQQSQDSLKRMLSFGSKRINGARILSDENIGVKKLETSGELKNPTSPQPYNKGMVFPKSGLNLSSNKEPRDRQKVGQINMRSKQKFPKNQPIFPVGVNKKSSPYLNKNKFILDSSNQNSGEYKKKPEKSKLEPLLSSLKREVEVKVKDKKQQKSLSFNKGQMFMNLKKRQEHHTQLCKEMNRLGVKIEVNWLTREGDRKVELTFVNKIVQSKHTAIFTAHHALTNSLYCLKRVKVADLGKGQLKNIITEHKIHQFCRHPHIVKYFGTATDNNHIYELMQYMQLGTLGHQLRSQVLNNMSQQNVIKTKINESMTSQISRVNKIRGILFELVSGLNYLHQRGIIHRDVKPQNIFISHDYYKLGDFGSASYNGSLQFVGTLDYVSPEILTQIPYDNRIDIWSLGCVAYELFVGRPPFFHINPEQTKRLAIQADYDRNLISDNQLSSLIQKMLMPSFRHRITASELLNHVFFDSVRSQSHMF